MMSQLRYRERVVAAGRVDWDLSPLTVMGSCDGTPRFAAPWNLRAMTNGDSLRVGKEGHFIAVDYPSRASPAASASAKVVRTISATRRTRWSCRRSWW